MCTYFLLHLLFGQKHCFFTTSSMLLESWGRSEGFKSLREIFKLQFDKPPKMGRTWSVTIFFFIALSKINWINKRVESFIYFLLVHTHFSCSKNTPFFLDSQHTEDAKSVSTVTTFAMYHHFQLWHDRSWRLSCLLTLTLILDYSLFHWQIRNLKSHPTYHTSKW